MTRALLTGNAACAWGARLADVDYIPAFPITPQTEIIELLESWIESGALDARLTLLESEHSMLTAAGAAAATGVRVFTATSSQGLLYALEMLYTVAGWRVPLVLANVSRGLAAPITLEADHCDVLAARDSGFLQIHCATCQEVLDSVLLAFRLAEHPEVRLPVLVNLDGFSLSFTREPVEIPSVEQTRAFLPAFSAGMTRFRAGEPLSQAVAVLGGGAYSYFRYQTHLAALAALRAYDEIAEEFARDFGRRWPAVDAYRCEDAELVFAMIGSFATKAEAAVDRLRDQGERVWLVRLRLVRPFPVEVVRGLLRNKVGVAVVDQNLSLGRGGVLHGEIASALQGIAGAPRVASFIGGLGGREIRPEEFVAMLAATRVAAERNEAPEPRLLYSAGELAELRSLQRTALSGEEGPRP